MELEYATNHAIDSGRIPHRELKARGENGARNSINLSNGRSCVLQGKPGQEHCEIEAVFERERSWVPLVWENTQKQQLELEDSSPPSSQLALQFAACNCL